MKSYRHILCGTDFSPASDDACIRALELARGSGAELTLLHIVDHFPEDRSNEEIAPEDVDPKQFHEERSRTGLREQALRIGYPEANQETRFTTHSAAYAITHYAADHDVDLIVVGSHAHSAIADLLGTTTGGVERHAGCEVLVLPHKDV
jgi:universal stress protein A